jgi:hypothetical protein
MTQQRDDEPPVEPDHDRARQHYEAMLAERIEELSGAMQ